MDPKIERLLHKSRTCRTVLLIAAPVTLCAFVLAAFLNLDPLLWVAVLGAIVTMPATVVYIEGFRSIARSEKYLKKWGLQTALHDLRTEDFQLPVSGIYLGAQAFYAKKPATVIPYAMAAWVYLRQMNVAGVIPVNETVRVLLRDGTAFEIRANRQELPLLLQRIMQHAPDLIVCYGRPQEQQFAALRVQFMQSRQG